MPADPSAVARVLADLQDGEVALLLKHVPDAPECPRRGGKKLNSRVAVRWSIAGVRGVKLDTACGPTGRITTRRALQRFLSQLNGIDTSVPDRHRPAGRRKNDTAAAQNVLAGAGFKT